MDQIYFALAIIGGLIGLFTFSYNVFKGMLNDVKKDLTKAIDETRSLLLDEDTKTERRLDKIIQEREQILNSHNINMQAIRDVVNSKPGFDYIDKTFMRLDVADLKFQYLMQGLKDLGEKMDLLLKRNLGGKIE